MARPATAARLRFRPRLEELENRLLLNAGADPQLLPCGCGCCALCRGAGDVLMASQPPQPATLVDPAPLASAASGALHSLSSIPALNSLPGAAASLFLDFDGNFESLWGSYSGITTPVFDVDGDASTFSDAELAVIDTIWRYVAEDYAPFNINVTTVEPASFANGEAVRVSIGGNGSWTGLAASGLSYVDSFTSSIANTAFVFPAAVANVPKWIAATASHEAGHSFGLNHQTLYDARGQVLASYYKGPGDGRAPLMGNAMAATRGLWWYGTSSSATTYQDDMAVIGSAQNGFGYRPDDHGDSAATATPLPLSGGSGIIAATSDRDYFSFTTTGGQLTFAVTVPADVNNLDARLELRDESGANLLAASDPGDSFNATITRNLAAGSYVLVVASHGSYGDVGQYVLHQTALTVLGLPPASPTDLSAAPADSVVNLVWCDNASNETGYALERSVNGVVWSRIANLAPDSTSFGDSSVVAGSTYYYRVCAVNNAAASTPSPVASATVTASWLPRGTGTFTDADGDIYTVKLSGPGQVLVALDADSAGRGSISVIHLQNTDSRRSSLTVTVRPAGGDGVVRIGAIEGSSLKTISARSSDLVGAGIHLADALSGLTLRNVLNGADIVTGGSSAQMTRLTAGSIGAGTDITLGSSLSYFSAAAVGAANISVPAIGTLSVAHDFDADLHVTGTGNARRPALGTATISGNITDAVWTILGDVRTLVVRGLAQNWSLDIQGTLTRGTLTDVDASSLVTTGSVRTVSARTFTDSNLFAGFNPTDPSNPLLGGAFGAATLGTFSVSGAAGAFASSWVAASKVGRVNLQSLTADNSDHPFGILADISVSSVLVKSPWLTLDVTHALLQDGSDFVVAIL